MPYWEGYQRQYRPNYIPVYVANAMPNYPQNVPRPPTTYKPSFTPNNAFQPNIEGQSFNQT